MLDHGGLKQSPKSLAVSKDLPASTRSKISLFSALFLSQRCLLLVSVLLFDSGMCLQRTPMTTS